MFLSRERSTCIFFIEDVARSIVLMANHPGDLPLSCTPGAWWSTSTAGVVQGASAGERARPGPRGMDVRPSARPQGWLDGGGLIGEVSCSGEVLDWVRPRVEPTVLEDSFFFLNFDWKILLLC